MGSHFRHFSNPFSVWGGGVSLPADALTSTTISSATKAGNGAELWDGSSFNSNVLDDLVEKLFGDEDPVEYVKKTKDEQTDSYVVTAATINAKVGNPTNGLVVTLNGKQWMAASMTITEASGEENIVLTLFLANDFGESQYYSTYSNTRGNNAYSSSNIRNHLLTNSNWAFFKDTGKYSFAQQYLVQPKNIKYQLTESAVGRSNPKFGQSHLLNESLYEFTSNWSGSLTTGYYKPSDTFADPNGKMVRYDAWGEDYIWLPSATETGWADTSSCIWELSDAQLAHNAKTYAWLRSGTMNDFSRACPMSSLGGYTSGPTNQSYGVRPAIHLNLTAAGLGSNTLKNPENIPTTYNSDTQTIKSAYTANPTAVAWYDSEKYETGNYVTVTPETELKNAGTHWVKVEITQNWIDAVNAEVDTEGAAKGWTADQITAVKNARRPKFKGDPVNEDGSHPESSTVRWFKFIISPKELSVTAPSYNSMTGVLSPPTFSNPAEFNGMSDVPALATKVSGTAANGTVFNLIDEIPGRRGTYTAQAILVNSSTDKTEYEGGNYVIKNASSLTCSITVNRARLKVPTAPEPSKTYSGEEIKFALTGYDEAWRETAILLTSDGIRLEGSDTDGWYLVAKDAGTYSVTAAIKQENKNDWCWDIGTLANETVEDQKITVTITRKTLYVDFMSSTGAFLMQSGAEVIFRAEPSNAIEGDDVKITLQYFNINNEAAKIPVPSGVLDASKIEDAGTFRMLATLEDTAAAANKNYVLDAGSSYQDFIISAQNIEIGTLTWQYRENNGVATPISGGAASGSPFTLVYTGGTFAFSLANTTAELAAMGVRVDASYEVNGYKNGLQTKATNGAVEVTVRLVPLNDGYAFNGSNGKPLADQFQDIKLYIKVDKATIDLSSVVWSADELEYTGMSQTVSIASGLPEFLSVNYDEGRSGTNVGEYTVKVKGMTVKGTAAAQAEAANYYIPSFQQITTEPNLTHTWRITKKRIDVYWITVETSADSTIVWIPYVDYNDTDAIDYSYYAADDTAMEHPFTLDEVLSNFDATKYTDYLVCARLNNPNYVFVENGQEVDYTLNGFQIGDNKNPVRVSLEKYSVVYNGTEQRPVVIVDAGGVRLEVEVTIEMKQSDGSFEVVGDASNPITYAGEYQVTVAVSDEQSGEFAITGNRKFTYIIEKADIDLSGMKWVDSENGDEEYVYPYIYNPKISHTLEYKGDALDLIDGLTMTYTSATATDAGKYTVTATFTVSDADLFDENNYNVPEDVTLEWEILPYTPDLSGVKWNYNNEPFTFKIVNGVPVLHSAELVGFPEDYAEELASMIIYGNANGAFSETNLGAFSDVGVHTTSFSINEDHEKRGNYGDLLFPSGLVTTLEWEIHPLKVEKGDQRQTKDFRAEGYSLKDITNLPDDYAEYFNVQVLDAELKEIAPTDGTWNFFNAGQYRIKMSFKQGMNKNNGGQFDNVKWADNARGSYQILLTVNKITFGIQGWTDGIELEKPTLNVGGDDALKAEIEKYFSYVLKQQSNGAELGADDVLDYDTFYTIALKLKAEYAGNVTISYNGQEGEETTPYVFKTGKEVEDIPLYFVEKPSEDELSHRYPYRGGTEITFSMSDLGSWFDATKMEIIGEMKGSNVGFYPVKVGFKSEAQTAWGDENNPEATITVTFEIYPNENSDRFILTDAAKESHPYKFQYGDFSELQGDISDYVYTPETALYITRLALNDTIAQLLAQFANGESIKVFDASGTEITDYTKVLMTGIMLRLVDGETVLNQLTVSVLGDVNGDGKINTIDKAQQNSLTLGTKELGAAEKLACDINADGKVNTIDKARLNSQSLGTIDIYEGLRLSAPAAQAVSETYEEVAETAIEPIVEEVAVIAIEEYEPVSESDREMPTREPISAAVVIADTRRLRVKF